MAAVTLKTIEDLRRMTAYPLDAMLQQVGPLALIQRGGGLPAMPTPLPMNPARTIEIDTPPVARQALGLMLDMRDGIVVPLGSETPDGTVVFGRAEDADVHLEDPSVSSHHAAVRYDAWKRHAWVKDLGSTNGTLVNGRAVEGELPLAEGNVITLGDDSAFLFLRTETLYALLKR